jgi:antitoxin CptB
MSTSLEHRRRRALFRAKHRGTKELDWLVGKYADAHLDAMSEADLTLFEKFLVMPDPDLHAWLMEPVPMGGSEFAGLVAAMRAFHGLPAAP